MADQDPPDVTDQPKPEPTDVPMPLADRRNLDHADDTHYRTAPIYHDWASI